jgi:alkylated DNA repair dioxygenase AlkB
MARRERSLFSGAGPDHPSGFVYRPGIVTPDEEATLVEAVRTLEFSAVRMRGQTARRRTTHFGWTYGYESARVEPGPPLPEFVLPLRARAAALARLEPAALVEVLITEYPSGAGIGWHRDAPAFGVVVGVSLLGPCRFRFGRGSGETRELRSVELAPRSAYVLDGEARWQWQHSIPPMRTARYSITYRTLRASGALPTAPTPSPRPRD